MCFLLMGHSYMQILDFVFIRSHPAQVERRHTHFLITIGRYPGVYRTTYLCKFHSK